MKYRKKPVVIEAFKYYHNNIPDWFMDKVTSKDIIMLESYCEIKTLEGIMRGDNGDFIIKGVSGEIYPCKSDIFEKTYEKAEGGELAFEQWAHLYEVGHPDSPPVSFKERLSFLAGWAAAQNTEERAASTKQELVE